MCLRVREWPDARDVFYLCHMHRNSLRKGYTRELNILDSSHQMLMCCAGHADAATFACYGGMLGLQLQLAHELQLADQPVSWTCAMNSSRQEQHTAGTQSGSVPLYMVDTCSMSCLQIMCLECICMYLEFSGTLAHQATT